MKDKILEAVQISKTYGEGESAVHALRNSDLTLENGTFASIIGSSCLLYTSPSPRDSA